MRKSIAWIVLLVFAVACLAGAALAAEKSSTGNPQQFCPVMGGKINKDLYADYEGKRVYFCCPGCREQFLKDPRKYLKKLQEQGVDIAETPR